MTDGQKNQGDQDVGGEGGHQPIFNLSPPVAALAGLIVAIQAAKSLVLNESGQIDLYSWFAFFPIAALEPSALPGGWLPLLWTPVTHALIHAGWEHTILNTVWLVIFATPLTHRYGGGKMLLLFALGAAIGAAAFAATTLPQPQLLVGASGGVAALTGAAIRFMFQPVQVAVDPATGERRIVGRRLATIGQVFRHPTARTFTILWLVLNAIVPLLPLFMPGMQLSVAWQAHLGGFLTGFLLVPLFERKSR